ncbi:MAG: DNA polymerase III subunit beta [Betaproteobacteria bacterium]|nr:MAG: DNA polymerase III subunit beta [Betaproteobacteria bacterium]
MKINREAILEPLYAVSGIIERRHTLPILSNVLLERDGTDITIVATDIEIQISARAVCDNPGEAKSITVGARKLLDILRALPEQSEITLALQEKKLQVKAAKSRFNLQTLPAEDFPKLSLAEGASTKMTLPQKVLKQLFLSVQYAMAQQDIRYYLNGLLLVSADDKITVVATDGHRLAFSCAAHETRGSQEVILPRKTIIELSKLLADSDETVEVELSPTQARFSFGGIVLISKLVDGKFPDYTRVIPTTHNKKLLLNRVVLLQALQRAAILTNEKFKGVRWVLVDGSLKIICSNNEQEEAQEELDVAYSGESLDIGFNVNYLQDVLNNLDCSEVECALGDANSSALITVPGNDNFKYVVMPMRI